MFFQIHLRKLNLLDPIIKILESELGKLKDLA
jgi:hypothetical protein